MGLKKAVKAVSRALSGARVPTGAQAAGIVTPRKAEGQLVEANRVSQQQAAEVAAQRTAYEAEAQRQAAAQKAAYDTQVAEYNRKLQEQMDRIREQQEQQASAERTQAMTPPEAQNFSKTGEQGDKRLRRSSARVSLLAGNTGGYNPATGGGRLGGRSLLG
jgi:hypothetical protein